MRNVCETCKRVPVLWLADSWNYASIGNCFEHNWTFQENAVPTGHALVTVPSSPTDYSRIGAVHAVLVCASSSHDKYDASAPTKESYTVIETDHT